MPVLTCVGHTGSRRMCRMSHDQGGYSQGLLRSQRASRAYRRISPGLLHLPPRGGIPIFPEPHVPGLREPEEQPGLPRARGAGERHHVIYRGNDRDHPSLGPDKRRCLFLLPWNRHRRFGDPETGDRDGGDGISRSFGVAEPGGGAAQSRRFEGFLHVLPRPAPVLDQDGQESRHLLPMPQGAGRARLRRLRGKQAREHVFLAR